MIPICFPQEIAIGLDDGSALRCLAADPAMSMSSAGRDPRRIYLALEETVHGTKQLCVNAGLAQPVILPQEVLASFPGLPLPLADFLEQAKHTPPAKAAICLVNGGGGGLGDGILFAPALDILMRRLRAFGIREIDITLCSLLPGRTASILGGIPGVRVTAMPLPLAEFLAHDAYADFSGMLTDPAFNSLHMTDFFLERMGIESHTVRPAEKEPFLNLAPRELPLAQAALARARAEAGGKPLAAVVFISSYTRTMPEPQAATLIGRLTEQYRPVVIFPEGFSAPEFLARHGLSGTVNDLSAASPDFDHYFALLAGVDAIVTVDTSAVHIGAALHKPTVALFNSIPMTTRISYSPTVHGIQLSYAGQQCHAPCGLSKARAYVEGKLADGRPFRLECGYACDEAVDRDRILTDAAKSAQSLPPERQILPSELESIRRAMADRFHEHLAPCWEALDLSAVVSAVPKCLAETEQRFSQSCPVCGNRSLHPRIGRFWGVDRLRCRTCQATFTENGLSPRPPEPVRQKLPAAAHTAPPLLSLIASLLPVDGSLLLVGGENDSWQETAWSRLLDPAALGSRPRHFWDRRCGDQPGTGTAEGFDAVILLFCLDRETHPGTLVTALRSHLKGGGLLIFPAHNGQYLGHPVSNPRAISRRPPWFGWARETITTLLDCHRLDRIWLGTSPVGWEDIEAAAGAFPSLTIQPPSHEHLSVKVQGRDLNALVRQYLAHVLQSIRDHGQFWLCCARKPL